MLFSAFRVVMKTVRTGLDCSRDCSCIARDFPAPSIPQSVSVKPETPAPQQSVTESEASVSNVATSITESTSGNSQKENVTPTASPGSPLLRPPVPPFSNSPLATIASGPTGSAQPALQSQLALIKDTLRNNFSHAPPHTIQRLAELILYPRKHYRTLHSYIRALDRVVSVSSGADIFPLPTATLPNAEGSGLLNGTSSIIGGGGSAGGLGSDESLGGALLTPIPWLQNTPALGQGEVRTESTEIVDGPNGVGSIETVSISMNGISSATPQRDAGMITQVESLRQDQEAATAPVSANTRASSSTQDSASQGGSGETHGEAKGSFELETALGRPAIQTGGPDPGATKHEVE
ncbi:hypothetical protein GP486_006119 [Trichoglossum hirsutum]|uniref:Protein phosphatase 4 core regulatory subunit R2 n=1 Tax=Trichoglossum hirsutum TaxID=265104 RepID=A0A9P8L7Y0_9PEZI|nr:hypothetical protein GP486_006119 [Trichoglossum hirsutum]